MDLVHKLNLNKHPKDNENLSLVNALNIKLSADESCLTNEESIIENKHIKKFIVDYFANDCAPAQEFNKIIKVVPLINELLIFATCKAKPDGIFIFRYSENENSVPRIYKNSGFIGNIHYPVPTNEEVTTVNDNLNFIGLTYHGGEIKTAFTYNTRNDLILAVAEYGVEGVDIPLRVINLGEFGHVNIESQFPNEMLSINPEIKIPSVSDVEYTNGNTYKGWYYLFFRLKISNYSNDYTQWYPIGYPIYIDDINKHSIIKYIFNRDLNTFADIDGWGIIAPSTKKGFAVGVTDNFSNEEDISNETFKIKLDVDYDGYYQIGAICASKSYTKAFKSNDIKIINNGVEEFIFNPKNMNETSTDELIIDNYNPFNVQNITNYKNRLYISNYKENSSNKNIDKDIINNISLDLVTEYFDEKSVVYDISILTKDEIMVSNQYTSDKDNSILLSEYLGIDGNNKVTIANGENTYTDSAKHFNIKVESGKWGYAKLFYRKYAGLGQIEEIFIGTDDNPISIINVHEGNKTITYNYKHHAISGGQPYINTKLGFNDRKKNSTLIPGEIYNFFIHFVDKYGHATNGYKIDNNIKWTTEDSFSEIIPYKITVSDINYYAALPIDDNIIYYDSDDHIYKMNVDNIKFYKTIDTNNYILINEYESPENFRHLLVNNSFLKKEYINYKWYQIIDSADTVNFNIFINSEGDRLFKVPLKETFIKINKSNANDIQSEDEIYYRHLKYLLQVNNVTIPDGYTGYFISYEKHEPIQRLSGVLARADFIQQRKLTDGSGTEVEINTTNDEKSNSMLFYSSQFDIADNYKLDYNLLKINGVNVFDKMDIPNWDYYQRTDGFNYVYDMNKPMINSINKNIINYAMPEFNIAPANSSIYNRSGLGTALQIKDSYNLFNSDVSDTDINLYYVTLLNITRDIYLNKDKNLIRLTDIIYHTNDIIIWDGYNGHWTYDGVLVYENSGLIFNDADKIARKLSDNKEFYKSDIDNDTPHTYQNDIPFAAYIQFPVCTDTFYESKRFKNKPDTIVFVTYKDDSDETQNKFAIGSMVTPANTIDLFENPQSANNDFTLKLYNNYADWRINVDTFDKTVRRSNIIQDESINISWRKFPVEAYKNISENKGKITNLIGVGYIFLVHTEHSLFMFDTNNMINAINTNLQITQPDAFEVDYKEVFTSLLGYGGLQDDKSWILDNFGYIYYNNDFNRFYKFDNGKLDVIDADIVQWLNKYKPYNIRFANDKINNRLLIKMNYNINNEIKNIVLSYNYNTNTFISLHSYYFDEAYNTKTQLYLKCNDIHHDCSLHYFIQDGSSYGKFDNVIKNIGEAVTKPSKISIIVNPSYLDIKWLEHITYKLTKSINASEIDYTISPVEGEKQPFSGNLIKVYNNLVNTGELDITVDNENNKNIFCDYTKPYWDLGNWNFNYLHNNIANHITQPFSDDFSRLYGNYFIIEFTFNNEDELKVEFEELDCKLIK